MDEKYSIKKGQTDPDLYIDLINYVFGFNGSERSFVKLLPKLFSPENAPRSTDDTVFVYDGGSPVACVGAFPLDYVICDTSVKAFGIGNVAVHPRYRGQGLMKSAMYSALDYMIKNGADMTVLSGRRHRYNHFGIEKCGTDTVYVLTAKTIGCLRPVPDPDVEMKRLERKDDKALDQIFALHNTRRYRVERPRERLYDILTSWQAVPYVFYKNGAFIGWAVLYRDSVSEIVPIAPEFAPDMASCLATLNFELSYLIPDFQSDVGNALWKYAETVYTGADLCMSVFNYQKIVSLSLRLKSEYSPLADGSLSLSIDGFAKHEDLVITVKNGVPSVSVPPAGSPFAPDISLSHLEAMQLLFMQKSPSRSLLPPALLSWFPLPIYVHSPDNV